MESILTLNNPGHVDDRLAALNEWLQSIMELPTYSIIPMQGDASFRRYFRIKTANGSFVAMDAPPSVENCAPFVAIAHALLRKGLDVPEIIEADIPNGFLLLTDFGDDTFLRILNEKNANALYCRALDQLVVLQSCREVPGHVIPHFDRELMLKEWAWHKEWFLQKWLKLSLSPVQEDELDSCYEMLIRSATQQPQVFMHRDYHSANLMRITDVPLKVGILDFQDALMGPVTYDLVSLLRDCYIAWPQQDVHAWVEYYRQQLSLNVNEAAFLRWFDLMGVQRHLKALLTFSRKKVRDNQSQYLQHVPRTLNYLLMVTRNYPELLPMFEFLDHHVKPLCEKV